MRNRLQSGAAFGLFIVAFIASGCMANDDDILAAAAPTTTGIPMGAPGAIGARAEPPAPILPRYPRSDGIQEKINPLPQHPKPGNEPVIPPSPFGTPPDDDPTPTPPTKKHKGTKI